MTTPPPACMANIMSTSKSMNEKRTSSSFGAGGGAGAMIIVFVVFISDDTASRPEFVIAVLISAAVTLPEVNLSATAASADTTSTITVALTFGGDIDSTVAETPAVVSEDAGKNASSDGHSFGLASGTGFQSLPCTCSLHHYAAALDDPKRRVRRAAARCREVWQALDAKTA
jgi:hypothetical protein